MSETRVTDLGERLDLDLMGRVATKLGWTVNTGVEVMGQPCDLYVHNQRGYYPIGFKQTDGRTDAIYDDWKDYAQNDLSILMSNYKEQLFLEKTHLVGFVETSRMETQDEVVIRVAR